MFEKKSKGFEILETLYKERLSPGMIYFPKKHKDDDKNYFASKLNELGYIIHLEYRNKETGKLEGFNAAIKITGIEYFEKIKESKTKSLQNLLMILFTAIIAFSTFINIALTALNIWLSN